MLCRRCGTETEDTGFATYRYKGQLKRRRVCKECRNRYGIENFEKLKKWRKEYNQKNRSIKQQKDNQRRLEVKKIIDTIKEKNPCADCGNNFSAVAMDFDHVRGKNKGVSNMVSGAYKLDLILEEIKFCDIVCACCHRIRTHKRRQNHAPNKSQSKHK